MRIFFVNIFRKMPILFRLRVSTYIKNPYSKLEDENKVIFIHIPKAAGNGITMSLFGLPSAGHFTWEKYAKNREKFMIYYKFSVVRDPYERFVSAFNYLKSGGIGEIDDEFSEKYLAGLDLNEFVRKLSVDSGFRKDILFWIHFRPQSDFIFDNNERLMVDDLYKLEDMNVRFKELADKVGVGDVQFSRVNENASKFSTELSDYAKEVVREIYSKDFRLLNYDA